MLTCLRLIRSFFYGVLGHIVIRCLLRKTTDLRVILMAELIAIFTIDVEPDYGGQLGESYRVLEKADLLEPLADTLARQGVQPTMFITGKMFDDRPAELERVLALGGEIQLHSYSHPTGPHNVKEEAEKGMAAFQRHFGKRPEGYRSPYGRIGEEDLKALATLGFRYDSSVHPGFRPGLPRGVDASIFPELRDDGMWEVPVGASNGLKAVISMSYLKFFGPVFYRTLLKTAGFPSILVIGSHLHDFIVTPFLERLPIKKRFRYLRHKHKGPQVLERLIVMLKNAGYEFLTITELLDELDRGDSPARNFHIVRR